MAKTIQIPKDELPLKRSHADLAKPEGKEKAGVEDQVKTPKKVAPASKRKAALEAKKPNPLNYVARLSSAQKVGNNHLRPFVSGIPCIVENEKLVYTKQGHLMADYQAPLAFRKHLGWVFWLEEDGALCHNEKWSKTYSGKASYILYDHPPGSTTEDKNLWVLRRFVAPVPLGHAPVRFDPSWLTPDEPLAVCFAGPADRTRHLDKIGAYPRPLYREDEIPPSVNEPDCLACQQAQKEVDTDTEEYEEISTDGGEEEEEEDAAAS